MKPQSFWCWCYFLGGDCKLLFRRWIANTVFATETDSDSDSDSLFNELCLTYVFAMWWSRDPTPPKKAHNCKRQMAFAERSTVELTRTLCRVQTNNMKNVQRQSCNVVKYRNLFENLRHHLFNWVVLRFDLLLSRLLMDLKMFKGLTKCRKF